VAEGDHRPVVGRFEAERRAPAVMEHPNIARVHDGGATDDSFGEETVHAKHAHQPWCSGAVL
jgi:hypothetical protein